MIFISAQPDEYYFLWQLKLQIFNFSSLGIKPDCIHVLICYDAKKGLSEECQKLFFKNTQATFFAYEDTRYSDNYTPSLRPHIIAKHFHAHPSLQESDIFYHDSDIVFSSLPDFDSLIYDKAWYASDTKSYLDSNYIKTSAGELIFEKMCDIVGVNTLLVERNDLNAGGAQYLMKNVSVEFWLKVEHDCERMFDLLNYHNGIEGFCRRDFQDKRIQSWCTDMWCIWFNALYFNKDFKVHKELNFSWAGSNIQLWEENKILHYTGAGADKNNKAIFRKTDYMHSEPFDDDLSQIDKNNCSYPLAKIISDYVKSERNSRIDLTDFTFLISIRIDSTERLDNIIAVTKNLSKYFNTSILVMEIDANQKINPAWLPDDVNYLFVKDDNIKLFRTHYNNLMINKALTKFIAIYDSDVIIPNDQIKKAAWLLRNEKASMVSPYDGSFTGVGYLFKAMFLKIIDAEFLERNEKKIPVGFKRSYGGANFMNKEHFTAAGMDNENITSWGPEDIERVKRMQILGFKVKRVSGKLYHLPHKTGINSTYVSILENEILMDEYLKVCAMSREELKEYVNSWSWISENTYIA